MRHHQVSLLIPTLTLLAMLLLSCAVPGTSTPNSEFKTDSALTMDLPNPDVDAIPSHDNDVRVTIREHYGNLHPVNPVHSLAQGGTNYSNVATKAFSAVGALQTQAIARNPDDGFWIAFWESGRAQVVGVSEGNGEYTMQLKISGPLDAYNASQWLTLRKIKMSNIPGCRYTVSAILNLRNIGPVINPAIFAVAGGMNEARELQLSFDVDIDSALLPNNDPGNYSVPQVYTAAPSDLLNNVAATLGRSRREGNMDNLISFVGSHCFDEVHRFATVDVLSFATNNVGVQSSYLSADALYLQMSGIEDNAYNYASTGYQGGFIHTAIRMSMYPILQLFNKGQERVYIGIETFIGDEKGVASQLQWLTFSAPAAANSDNAMP